MICILKKTKKRKAKLGSHVAVSEIRRGGLTLAKLPTARSIASEANQMTQERAPSHPPEISLHSLADLEFIDSPSFHARGAEKQIRQEVELAAIDRGVILGTAPATVRRETWPRS